MTTRMRTNASDGCSLSLCVFFLSILLIFLLVGFYTFDGQMIGVDSLTLIVIFGGDGEYGVLNVLIFVDLGLVQVLVEVRRVVVLVGDANSDEFRHCFGRGEKKIRER